MTTKIVPERVHQRIAELDDRIREMCAMNLTDSADIVDAQGRIRAREEAVAQLQTEVDIVRMGVAAWREEELLIEPPEEPQQQSVELVAATPATTHDRILHLLAEANRPMKNQEITRVINVKGGKNTISSALSDLKKRRLVTHLRESREWAIG